MGLKRPYIAEIAPDTYAINEYGMDAAYLLIGREEALLIDTGVGFCDLKSIVTELTDLPYKVALTHGHVDHAGGMRQFDKIYLNRLDQEMAEAVSLEQRRGFVDRLIADGSGDVWDLDPDTIPDYQTTPEYAFIEDGDVFQLGDRPVTVYNIPGHTPGGMVFMDDTNRIMISGDCVNENLLASNASIPTIKRAMEKVLTLKPRYDQNWAGHLGWAGAPYFISQKKDVAESLLHICELVLAGEDTPEHIVNFGRPACRMTYRGAMLSYDPTRLTED